MWRQAMWLDARHEPLVMRCPECGERSLIDHLLEPARCDCTLDTP